MRAGGCSRQWRASCDAASAAHPPSLRTRSSSTGALGCSAASEIAEGQPWFVVPNNTVCAGIRINLAGRESRGVVEPGSDFERVCDQLATDLLDIVKVESGEPLVLDVSRASDHYERLEPDAFPDLLVEWDRRSPTHTVYSPKVGIVHEPYEHWRTGDHFPGGLLLATGPGIAPGAAVPGGPGDGHRAHDLRPTRRRAPRRRRPPDPRALGKTIRRHRLGEQVISSAHSASRHDARDCRIQRARRGEFDVRGVGMHRGTGVLVVGGGFLGSHLVAGLAAEGARVTVLTRTRPQGGAAARIAGARTVVSDAADPAAVEHALENVDHVVWCAGGLLPADSNLDPIADVRDALPPVLTMLEVLRRRPQVGITFVSSGGTVYGNPTLLPVPESHPTSPLTSHGVTRVAAEHYLALYQDVYGVPV